MNSYSTCWWSLLLTNRPREDERLSWHCWLTYSGRFTHINGYPSAAGPVQTSESSPVREHRRRSTTEPPNQLVQNFCGRMPFLLQYSRCLTSLHSHPFIITSLLQLLAWKQQTISRQHVWAVKMFGSIYEPFCHARTSCMWTPPWLSAASAPKLMKNFSSITGTVIISSILFFPRNMNNISPSVIAHTTSSFLLAHPA